MAPKLYMVPYSPPVRAVLLCANALGIELEQKRVNTTEKEQMNPEYLKMNPQHTVPTLKDDDGFVLWDSHAIMPYLIGKYGKDKSLYPDDIKKRAMVNQRLHFDSGIFFPRGAVITKGIFYRGEKTISQDAIDLVKEAYGFVENYLEKSKFTAGDEMTIADFSIVTTLTTWDVIIPLERGKYPKINAWLQRMESLPYFEKNNRPGIEMYRSLIQSRLAA